MMLLSMKSSAFNSVARSAGDAAINGISSFRGHPQREFSGSCAEQARQRTSHKID
jgi:hypothetical protein